MNRIVKRHLPVSALPKDWQAGLPKNVEVRVEINVEERQPARRAPISALVGRGTNVHGTEEQMLKHIAAVRADR